MSQKHKDVLQFLLFPNNNNRTAGMMYAIFTDTAKKSPKMDKHSLEPRDRVHLRMTFKQTSSQGHIHVNQQLERLHEVPLQLHKVLP